MILANTAFAVVITGSVIDTGTQAAIKDVQITFRVGPRPNQYPVMRTDSTGSFSASFALEQNFLLQYYLENSGYVLKRGEILVTGDSIALGVIYLKQLVQNTIWFCGTLIDSVTGSPLSGVDVHFTRIQGAYYQLGFVTTDSAGKFGYRVVISNTTNEVVCWSINQTGYWQLSDIITFDQDSVLQTLRLKPWGSVKIPVSGKVISQETKTPIANAKVVLTTNYLGVKPDSSYTDNQGNFRCFAEIGTGSGSEMPSLVYAVTAGGFAQKYGRTTISTKQSIDLGNIELPAGSFVISQRAFRPQSATRGMYRGVVLLNGRTVANMQPKTKQCASQVMVRAAAGVRCPELFVK
jgi:hypothetical protein